MTLHKECVLPDKLPDVSTLLTMLKSNYLDNRNVGIRRFSSMTSISRTRLQKLFDGNKSPTEDEMIRISMAMDIIEVEYTKGKEVKEKKDLKEEINKMLDNAFKEGLNKNAKSIGNG